MTEYRLLGEFVTMCTRCKLELNHRITLLNGDVPKRVLCLTCQTEHAWKRLGGTKKSEPVTRRLSGMEMASVRKSHEEDAWKAKLSDKSRTPVPYAVDMMVELDDHIYHPTFGLGVVIGFSDPDKVQIYFDGEVKLLKGRKTPQPEKKAARILY